MRFANVRGDLAYLAELKGMRPGRALVEGLLLENGFLAVILFRCAHAVRRWGIPALGPLIARFNLLVTGVDISPGARIGPGLFISHGVGLVIGGGVEVGRRAVFHNGVNVGAPSLSRREAMPQIGDDVFVGAGARILGPIRLGDRVFVGANAVVHQDVPDDSKVVSSAGVTVARRGGPAPPAAPSVPEGGGSVIPVEGAPANPGR